MSAAAPFIRLHPDDNIAVASRRVTEGSTFSFNGSGTLTVRERIDMGHKIALRPIEAGQPIKKFGQTIGYASSLIPEGSWVHVHNVTAGELSLDYAFCSAIPAAPTPIEGRTFQGYRRPDGRAATRNYIGIISTVNCSATASKYAAQKFDTALLEQFPNVDGVVPLVHKGGCAMQYGGEDHKQLTRTLAGFARHPNIAAYIVLGLGCETAQASFLMENGGLIQLGGAQVPNKAPHEYSGTGRRRQDGEPCGGSHSRITARSEQSPTSSHSGVRDHPGSRMRRQRWQQRHNSKSCVGLL
jgi:altronate hydrolase